MDAKQAFLDHTPQTNEAKIAQMFVRFYSKTTLSTVHRAIRALDVTLYTTELKNTSFAELKRACESAISVLKLDSKED